VEQRVEAARYEVIREIFLGVQAWGVLFFGAKRNEATGLRHGDRSFTGWYLYGRHEPSMVVLLALQ
jgi:hypothetical protein